MSKNMVKKYIALIIVFFAWTHIASASFEITEIMYDLEGTDTNREWIEVENTGSSAEDLSKWFFFSDNTKHSLVPQSASEVPAGGYAVIVQNVTSFRSDWPNFSGLIFDSSWTGFNNEGEDIALKDPNQNIVSPVSFNSSMGGSGNGNSLQKVGGSWVEGGPTPGASNQGGSGGGGEGETNTSTTQTQSDTKVVKKKEIETPVIATSIISPTTVFSGIPFKITAKTEGYSKEPLTMGRFVWNFGDGNVKVEAEHKPFDYVYKYPGDYVITLSYYRVFSNTKIDATDRLTIKVLPSEVLISSVGGESDPYVEVENKSSFEVDLSNWVIKSYLHSFIIPPGTIILPGKKLKFSQQATNFNYTDLQYLILQSSIGEIAYTYPAIKPKVASNYRVNSQSSKSNSTPSNSDVIDLNDLGASATSAKNIDLPSNILPYVGLLVVIVLGVITVILIRKKRSDDYIDGEIRAEDMTIIE